MTTRAATTQAASSLGGMLRAWRTARRMSQLELALCADVSTRHLSFIETGRAQPSREMLMRLSDRLHVPLRERNALLLAAGFAPLYKERPLDDPALGKARKAVELVLKGHEPYPALAVDRHWNLVAANDAVPLLLAAASPALLRPPVNVLRVALHPDGLASRIVNLAQTRHHLLGRLQGQIDASQDASLVALLSELAGYPKVDGHEHMAADDPGIMIPLKLRAGDRVLSFFSTLTVFGSPLEVTLSELAIEAFFPADEETAEHCRVRTDPSSAP